MQNLRDSYEDKVLVAIVSFIKYSDKNRRLIEAISDSPRVLNQGRVAFAIEDWGAGVQKECDSVRSESGSCLIDDNAEIRSVSNVEKPGTVGDPLLQLRRKPPMSSPQAVYYQENHDTHYNHNREVYIPICEPWCWNIYQQKTNKHHPVL